MTKKVYDDDLDNDSDDVPDEPTSRPVEQWNTFHDKDQPTDTSKESTKVSHSPLHVESVESKLNPSLHFPESHFPAPLETQLLQSEAHSETDKVTMSSSICPAQLC